MVWQKRVNKHLGEILMELGVINDEQLSLALRVQKDRDSHVPSGEVLIELGFAREEHIVQALNTQYRFPYLPIDNCEVNSRVLSFIPAEIARKHALIPIDIIGNTLTIAMANPLDKQAIAQIQELCKHNIQIFITTPSQISRALDRYYNDENLFPKLAHDFS